MKRSTWKILPPFMALLLAFGCGEENASTAGPSPDAMMMANGDASTDLDGGMDAEAAELDAEAAEPDAEPEDAMAVNDMATDAEPVMDMETIPDYDGPRKKGLAVTHRTYDWSYMVSTVKPFWSYSWGKTLSRFQPDGVEFVPMQWCCELSDEVADSLRAQYDAGEIKYLLGYNEPDGAEQANMTVERAITLWRQLEATGIPLVSPSPVHTDGEWFEAFMERALSEGLRIDYIGFHSYGGTNAQWFLNRLDALYEQYQIPIWITEFAVADWNTENREGNQHSPEAVLEFMQTVLPELDRRDHIVRYAWYTDFSSRQLWPSALFDADRELTPLGEFYTEHTANPLAGPPKPYPIAPEDPDNLMENGGFELGSTEGWGGYENRVVNIDDIEPHEGAFLGRLRGGFSSAFDQRVSLQAGVTYRVSLHSRWSENPGQDVGANMEEGDDNTARTSAQLPRGTEWAETTFTVTPTETKEYVFWIWTGPGIAAHLYLDTVSIRAE